MRHWTERHWQPQPLQDQLLVAERVGAGARALAGVAAEEVVGVTLLSQPLLQWLLMEVVGLTLLQMLQRLLRDLDLALLHPAVGAAHPLRSLKSLRVQISFV